jgi:hypothetical protein
LTSLTDARLAAPPKQTLGGLGLEKEPLKLQAHHDCVMVKQSVFVPEWGRTDEALRAG